MATDTPPATAGSPSDLPRPDAGDERREGVLATMLGAAATPIEPARTPEETASEADPAAGDVPVTEASSSDFHGNDENPTQNGAKNGTNGQVDTDRSVIKTLTLAAIDRWAQGGNLAAKRLDIAKVQAQRAPKIDTKEDRKTNRTETTATQNSNGSGAGGKNLSAKDKATNSDKGRANNSNNKTQNVSDKSPKTPGGNGGSTRQGPAGPGSAGSGGAGRTPAKETPKTPAKDTAPKPPAKPNKPAPGPAGGGTGKGPSGANGSAGKGNSGATGGGSGQKGSGASTGGGGKPSPSPTSGGAGKGTTGTSGKNLPPTSGGGKDPAQGPSPRPWKDPARTGGGKAVGGDSKSTPKPAQQEPAKPQKPDAPKNPSGTGAGRGGAASPGQGGGKPVNGADAAGGKGTPPPPAPIWKGPKGAAPQSRGNALKDRLAQQDTPTKAPGGTGGSGAGKNTGTGNTGSTGPGAGAKGKDQSSTPAGKNSTPAAGGAAGKSPVNNSGWKPPAGNTPVLTKARRENDRPAPQGPSGRGTNQGTGRGTGTDGTGAGKSPSPTPPNTPKNGTGAGPKPPATNSTGWRPPADNKPVLRKADGPGDGKPLLRNPDHAKHGPTAPVAPKNASGPTDGGAPKPAPGPLPKPVTIPPTKPTHTRPAPKDASKPAAGPALQDATAKQVPAPRTVTGPTPKNAPQTPKTVTGPTSRTQTAPKDATGPAVAPKTERPATPGDIWKPAPRGTDTPKNRPTAGKDTPQPLTKAPKDVPPTEDKPGAGRKLYDPAKPYLGAGAATSQTLKKQQEKPGQQATPRTGDKQETQPKTASDQQPKGGTDTPAKGGENTRKNPLSLLKDRAKNSTPTKDTKPGDRTEQDPARPEQTPIRTQTARTAGYRLGSHAALGAGQVKALVDGAKDGWTDGKAATDHDKARLDQARADRKTAREKDKPMTTPPATSADYSPRTLPEHDDHQYPKPVQVGYTTSEHIQLAGNASRAGISRGEVRNLVSFQRHLGGKTETMTNIAERSRALHAHAKAQSEKVTQFLERAKGVAGGEKLVAGLIRLQETSKSQESLAIEVQKRAARSSEECQFVSGNVDVRYTPIYQAVVDSDVTTPAELDYYRDMGVTPNG